MNKQFEQAYDNFLAGCDVDTTMLDCAEFMFNAGRESVGQPLAAEKPPLVRLTDEEIESCNHFSQNRYKFAHAIMDAMERANK